MYVLSEAFSAFLPRQSTRQPIRTSRVPAKNTTKNTQTMLHIFSCALITLLDFTERYKGLRSTSGTAASSFAFARVSGVSSPLVCELSVGGLGEFLVAGFGIGPSSGRCTASDVTAAARGQALKLLEFFVLAESVHVHSFHSEVGFSEVVSANVSADDFAHFGSVTSFLLENFGELRNLLWPGPCVQRGFLCVNIAGQLWVAGSTSFAFGLSIS